MAASGYGSREGGREGAGASRRDDVMARLLKDAGPSHSGWRRRVLGARACTQNAQSRAERARACARTVQSGRAPDEDRSKGPAGQRLERVELAD